jgi:uncharacterized protein YegP (UPF0339 family)
MTKGRVVVVQQPDGWWRWCFEPTAANAETLVSGEAYPERSEAVQSAEQAYPGLQPDVAQPAPDGSRLRALVRRTALAALVLAVLVAAARSGNRRTD